MALHTADEEAGQLLAYHAACPSCCGETNTNVPITSHTARCCCGSGGLFHKASVSARVRHFLTMPLCMAHLLIWHACAAILLFCLFVGSDHKDGRANPAALTRTRAWVKAETPNWWDDASTRHSYDFAADPTSSIASPLTSRDPIPRLSAYARTLPLQPALLDCRVHFDRTPAAQKALEARLVAEHKRSALSKHLHGNVPAPWLVANMAELETELVAESHKFVPALARWLLPELDRLGWKARPVPLRCTQHAVMLIESRSNPFVVFAIRNTFLMLSSDTQRWGLIIFHSAENERQLVEGLEIWPGGAGQHIVMHAMEQSDGVIDRSVGNKLILSSALWETVPEQVENILLIQADALMIKPAGADLPLWHKLTNQYAYVGAPFPIASMSTPDRSMDFHWEDFNPFGGNGGLSFRKRSVMLDLTRHITCDGWRVGRCKWEERFPRTATNREDDDTYEEDRWIARELYRRSYKYRNQIPFPEVARKFSVDTVFEADPFFVHKYWQMWDDFQMVPHEVAKELVAGVKNYYKEAVAGATMATSIPTASTLPRPSPGTEEIRDEDGAAEQ